MIMPLSVKNQSIESSGITKDYKEAICEYVWNGFEANASEVRISYTLGEMGGLNSVIISDNGSGIDYNDLPNTFGAFLTSQKNNLSLKLKSKSNKPLYRLPDLPGPVFLQGYEGGSGLRQRLLLEHCQVRL